MKLLPYTLFLVLSIAFTSSCKKAQNNTLVVHLMSEPEDMHPTNGASAVRAEINLYTNLSLLRVNYKTGELLPCLAKALPSVSADGLNYTYELKDNMTWDDNSPITANDIAFTTKASKCLYTNNIGLKPYWENIDDVMIDSKNNKKFTIKMKRPYILNTWFWTDFPIVQAAFYDKQNILSKYSNAQLTDSTFLKTKADDVSTMIDYASFTELSKDEEFKQKYTLKLADTYNYTYVAMNMKPDGKKNKKLFTDVAVRKAMALLTPYDQINKTLYENNNKQVVGPISPNKIDFNTDLKPLKYNIEQAKELLKQAGWADTDNDQVLDKMIDGEKVKFEFNINFMSGSKVWEDLAKQLAESFGKVNIYTMLNPLDYNGFFTAVTSHNFDMSISAWQSSAPPEDFSQLWSSASWANNGLNFTGFGTPQTDALIDSINTCMNEPKRIELSKRFQKLVYDEQPYIFMFTQTRRVIVSNKWENIEVYTEYPGVLLNTLKLKD